MADDRDIPSLTLRVLENIQAELVGLRGEVRGLDGRMERVEAELKILNTRFDNFLSLVGKDVQDLKDRVGKLETHVGLR